MKKHDKKELDVNIESFPGNIASLVLKLADDDGMIRKKARVELENYGPEVIDYVHQLTDTENIQLRWEASKVLEQIGDIRSIPVFINLLKDEESDIRWIAAEGLIRIGKASIHPILEEIKHHGESIYIREGAHHVLWEVFTDDQIKKFGNLLNSLNSDRGLSETAPYEATMALRYF